MISIVLADDHRILRHGLKGLLEKQEDFHVAGEAGNGLDAVRMARELAPRVMIVDLKMPGMNGIEAIGRIAVEAPGVQTLALSMESDRRFVVEALKAGASGYLVKDCGTDELYSAVRTVAAGEVYLGPGISRLLVKEYLQRIPEGEDATLALLTCREREVLQQVADGMSTKEIAYRYGVSLKTVETQRQSVMKKLNLFSIAELTKYAVREGLTSLG
jgi:DNA-binding NarL/FixJ family response regulator